MHSNHISTMGFYDTQLIASTWSFQNCNVASVVGGVDWDTTHRRTSTSSWGKSIVLRNAKRGAPVVSKHSNDTSDLLRQISNCSIQVIALHRLVTSRLWLVISPKLYPICYLAFEKRQYRSWIVFLQTRQVTSLFDFIRQWPDDVSWLLRLDGNRSCWSGSACHGCSQQPPFLRFATGCVPNGGSE